MKKWAYENYLRFFYDITGDLDDDKGRKIEIFADQVFIVVMSVLLVGVLVSFLFLILIGILLLLA